MRRRRDPFGTLIIVVGLATTLALVAGVVVPGLRYFLRSTDEAVPSGDTAANVRPPDSKR